MTDTKACPGSCERPGADEQKILRKAEPSKRKRQRGGIEAKADGEAHQEKQLSE